MIKAQGKHKNVYPLILLCIAVLTLLEISLESSIITVFFLTIVALFGNKISVSVGYHNCGVAIGTVVGVGVFVFCAQLLLIIGITSEVAHWSVILIMTAVLVYASLRSKESLAKSEYCPKPQNFMAATVALVVAAIRQPWMLPFTCVVVVTGIWIQSRKITLKTLITISTMTSIGWFASSLIRPKNWWHINSNGDSQFFESLSWSIAKWSIFEHPGFAGGSIAKYHWLDYALLGGISELAQLEPWSALLKIGPLLIYFLLAQIIISEAQVSFAPRLAWHWIVIVLGIMASGSQFADSWALSIVVALSFLILARRSCNAPKLYLLLFWGFLSAVLLFTKLSTAVVVAAILSIKIFLDQKQRRFAQLVPLFSVIFIGIALAIPISQGNTLSMFSTPRFSTNAVIDLLVSLVSVERLLPKLLIWMNSAFLLGSFLKTRLGSTGISTLILTLPSILVSTLFYADFAEGKKLGVARASAEYFLFTQAILLTIFCSVAMLSFDTGKIAVRPKSQNALILSVLAVGIVAGSYWRHRSIGILIGSADTLDIFAVVAMTAFSATIILFTISRENRIFIHSFIFSLFILLSGVISGFRVNEYFRNMNNPAQFYSTEETAAPNLGTSDLIAVGKYIRDNTRKDAVLASNNFYFDRFQGGENFLLPAETRRRFLIQGLAYQTFFGTPSAEQMQRMNLSVEFADQPSALVLKRLKEYGVMGYVVNLALTDRRDWSEFAIEAFRSGDFVFLVFN